jgi:hypothetical protein
MKKQRKLNLYVTTEICFFIALVLFLTSMAGVAADDDAGSEPDVRITMLEVYELSPLFYDIEYWIHNYENYDVTVEIENTLLFPNGAEHNVMMGPYVIQENEDFGMSILCMYQSHLTGTYTWVVTVKDTAGVVLDEKSVSWEREEGWIKDTRAHLIKVENPE